MFSVGESSNIEIYYFFSRYSVRFHNCVHQSDDDSEIQTNKGPFENQMGE